MPSLRSPSAPVKPRKVEKTRTCRLCCYDPATRSGLARIDEDGQSAYYHVREFDADFGRGFRVTKHVQHEDGSATINDPYHVNLRGKGSSCECKGYLRWWHCRHIEMLQALIAAGKIV